MLSPLQPWPCPANHHWISAPHPDTPLTFARCRRTPPCASASYQRQRRVQRPGNMSAGTRSAGARPRRNAAGLIDGPSGPRPPGDDDSDDGGAGGASGPSVSSTTRHPSPVLPTAEPYKAPGATSAAPATNPQQITLEQSRTVNRRVARNPSGQAANMSAVDTHQLDKNWIVRLTEFFEKHKDKVLEGEQPSPCGVGARGWAPPHPTPRCCVCSIHPAAVPLFGASI